MFKANYKIIAIAVVLGLASWIVDNIIDYFIFYKEHDFINLLTFNAHELYMRSVILSLFILFGIIISRYITRIEEGEGRYYQLFNNVNDCIFATTRTNGGSIKIIEANAVGYKCLGYSKEELLQLSPDDLLDPGELNDWSALGKEIETDEHAIFETVLRSKNGAKIPVEVNAHRFYLSGKPIVLSIVRDITLRKQAEERILAAQLLNIQDTERSRISKDLHDEIGQVMILLKFQLSAIQAKLTDNCLQHECDELLGQIDGAIENIRRLAKDLSPISLENLGLSAAVRFLIEDFSLGSNIEASLDIDEVDKLLSPQAQLNIYRIFQETLTNIARHAQARHVSAMIKKQDDGIYIMIQDDGKGFDVNEIFCNRLKGWGFGLATIDERVKLIGGSLDLVSRPGAGTKITFTVPVGGEINNGPLPHPVG